MVNLAVVGAGYWGPNLVRNFLEISDCAVLWICDEKKGRLKYVQDRWPHIPVTSDFKTVINDPRVDAVVLATPMTTHHALGIAALNQDKHVFIEKPLATSSVDAGELVELANKRGLIIATGHLFVFHPAVSTMRTLLENDSIGALCYAESSRVNLGPPNARDNVIWDLAVHDISILLHLWRKKAIEVNAVGRRFRHPRLIDTAFINVKFEDDTFSQHHVSWLSPDKIRRFFVAGAKGVLSFDDTAMTKLKVIGLGEDSRVGLKDDEVKDLYYKPDKIHAPEIKAAEPLRVECEHFVSCVKDEIQPVANGESGLAVVKILEAAQNSIIRNSIPIALS
jgi:predicted dehydrogenase